MRLRSLETWLHDLRFSLRILAKNPTLTLIAVLTLAIGIGANTAIFSVINAVLLRPLPFSRPEQIVVAYERRTQQEVSHGLVNPADFLVWQKQNQVFATLAAYTDAFFNLTGSGEPERLHGLINTSRLLTTLGRHPMLGRDFSIEDDQPGAPDVVILSHQLWQRRFAGDGAIINRMILLDGAPVQVVGVMPPGFYFPNQGTELWMSRNLDTPTRNRRGAHFLTVIGRLKDGITLAQAQDGMVPLAADLARQFPATNAGHGVNLFSLVDETHGPYRRSLIVLFGAVALVLLIACVNVTNLSLTRAAARHRELTLRVALGASCGRLLRLLLSESLLLSLTGGTLGLLLAIGGMQLLPALDPGNLPRLDEVNIDMRVLSFTLLAVSLTGAICGLLPAWQATRLDCNDALKKSGHSSMGDPSGHRTRNLLVVSEIALALVLLVGAGLLMKSFIRLLAVQPGFAAENVLTMELSLAGERFKERQVTFVRELLQRLERLPGVRSAGTTSHLPLSGEDGSRSFSLREDNGKVADEKFMAEYRVVTPGYFPAMKIPLRAGRWFTEQDNNDDFDRRVNRDLASVPDQGDGQNGAPIEERRREAERRAAKEVSGVAVINESLARRCFSGINPLGQRLIVDDGSNRVREIIGVVGDVKHFGLDRDLRPEIYLPLAQKMNPNPNLTLVIHTTGSPTGLVPAVRREVMALDQYLPIYGIKTMKDYLSDSFAARRLNLLLLGVFAAVALLLAGIGIYGVTSYTITQRTREIGLRIALGANNREVLILVFKQGLQLTLAGVMIGIAVSFTFIRVMSSMLYGVGAFDPSTFMIVILILVIVTLLACWIPARRATRIDPMIALQYE